MDVNAIPPDLAHLKPFLQRGAELRKADPVITYYCFYFAVQQAIEIKTRSKEATGFLFKLMDELEGMKKSLAGNECITNESVGYSYFENFALKIFLRADTEDREGKATKYLLSLIPA
jgi:vacuolar protein sorting-associated protein VTA1